MPNAHYGDDPDKRLYRQQPPQELQFKDQRGTVHLLKCHTAGMTTNLFAGIGRIVAELTVFERNDSHPSFDTIQGLRTRVQGLRSWLGVTSFRTSLEHGSNGLAEALTVSAKSPAPLDITSTGIRLVPRWGRKSSKSSIQIDDLVYVESDETVGHTWTSHIDAHFGIRDLLVVSRWRRVMVGDARVRQGQDASRSDGVWCPVVTSRLDPEVPTGPNQPSDLLKFSELGTEGIARFFQLRASYARALDPVLSSRYLTDPTIETLMTQVGIGMEALGYLVAQDQGKSERQANSLYYADRCRLIGKALTDILPFDPDQWARESADSYAAVKHANRTLPDVATLANAWRKTNLALRCWVALELGTDPDILRERASSDPQANAFVAA